jgi:hypothetical protein
VSKQSWILGKGNAPEKCTILKPEVTFLGHVVSQKGIKPNPDNIAKILSWPAPKNVSEVRQILGMGSYYRRFIKDFSYNNSFLPC